MFASQLTVMLMRHQRKTIFYFNWKLFLNLNLMVFYKWHQNKGMN